MAAVLLAMSAAAPPGLPRASAPPGLRLSRRAVPPPGRNALAARAAGGGGERIPDAVVEAEKKSAPGRTIRLGVYTAAAGVAGLVTLDQVGGMLGVFPPDFPVLPSAFDNAALGVLANVAFGTGAVVLRGQELDTRAENQQRIWDEVQRRKAAGTLGKGGAQAINESASFADMLDASVSAKKGGYRKRGEMRGGKSGGEASGKPANTKGFGGGGGSKAKASSSAPTAAPSDPKVQEPTAPAAEEAAAEAGGKGGILGGAKQLWADANAAGRAQAMAVNDQLEDAGVLPPLEQSKGKGEEK